SPLVGWKTPVTTLKTVVLPAPLGPISPKISPRSTCSETVSSAVTPPNRIVRFESSSRASAIVVTLQLVRGEADLFQLVFDSLDVGFGHRGQRLTGFGVGELGGSAP